MTEMIQIIREVGFPIAAFLLMFWQNNTTLKANNEALNNITAVLHSLAAEMQSNPVNLNK